MAIGGLKCTGGGGQGKPCSSWVLSHTWIFGTCNEENASVFVLNVRHSYTPSQYDIFSSVSYGKMLGVTFLARNKNFFLNWSHLCWYHLSAWHELLIYIFFPRKHSIFILIPTPPPIHTHTTIINCVFQVCNCYKPVILTTSLPGVITSTNLLLASYWSFLCMKKCKSAFSVKKNVTAKTEDQTHKRLTVSPMLS